MTKQKQRFYLDCPYADKDECKELGGYWDRDIRKWYVPKGIDREGFRRWWPGAEHRESLTVECERVYLEVDFSEKTAVKTLGARWDVHKKKWYVLDDDKMKFKDWWPTVKEVAEESQISCEEEAADFLSVDLEAREEISSLWDQVYQLWDFESAELPPVPDLEGPRAIFKQELEELKDLCPDEREWRSTFRLDRESIAFLGMDDDKKWLMTN